MTDALDFAAAAKGIGHFLNVERQPTLAAENDASPSSPWDKQDGFQLSGVRQVDMPFLIDGNSVTTSIRYQADGPLILFDKQAVAPADKATLIADSDTAYVINKGRQTAVAQVDFAAQVATEGSGVLRAPMHGKVLAILTSKGSAVRKGQRVAILEAMKMEHALTAPFDGTVTDIAAAEGSQIAERATIMTIESAA